MSGNPGGRPAMPKTSEERRFDADMRQLAREHGPDAIAKIRAIMDDENAPHMARLNAANSLLDRGYGRPGQSVELHGNAGGPIQTEQPSALEIIESRLAAIRERMQAGNDPENDPKLLS
jgi:hypothetical protein